MKTVKTKDNQILKFYTLDETFKKVSKSKEFLTAYNEEVARLQLVRQVREMRIKSSLTQKALAKKADMPQSVIARLESGEHSFTLATLSRIAQVFNKKIQLA